MIAAHESRAQQPLLGLDEFQREAVARAAQHHCLDYSMSRTPGSWELAGPNGPQRVAVQGRLRVNNSLVIRDALLAGAGLARLPSFYVADELERKQLRAVLTDFALPPLSISAVYPKAKQLSPKVRVFVDFLRERFASAPWALRDPRARES
jgi:DNA-binding transcriptional LysR family regulator